MWKNRSCPMSSPFHDDARGAYHLGFRLGNYPFVTGTRPAKGQQTDEQIDKLWRYRLAKPAYLSRESYTPDVQCLAL